MQGWRRSSLCGRSRVVGLLQRSCRAIAKRSADIVFAGERRRHDRCSRLQRGRAGHELSGLLAPGLDMSHPDPHAAHSTAHTLRESSEQAANREALARQGRHDETGDAKQAQRLLVARHCRQQAAIELNGVPLGRVDDVAGSTASRRAHGKQALSGMGHRPIHLGDLSPRPVLESIAEVGGIKRMLRNVVRLKLIGRSHTSARRCR